VFVDEYLRCWNATKAARRVGYSSRSARSIGAENLTKPDIQAEINSRLAESGLSAAEVLARLTNQARGSFSCFIRLTDAGQIDFDFSSREAQDHVHLIKRLRVKRRRVEKAGQAWEHEWIEIELIDAQAALIQLGRHHRLFTDRIESIHPLTIPGLDELLDKTYGKRRSPK
jgi:phage terminase small subunit